MTGGRRPRAAAPVLGGLLLVLGALAACPRPASGTDIHRPPFFTDQAGLFDRVADGEFAPLLEVHLTEYAADPRWQAEWAASRFERSGLFMEYGSVSGKRLFVDRDLGLNVSASGRVGLGYDRRDWQDGRFELTDERLHAHWEVVSGWSAVVAGWPTHRKRDASLGAGVRVGKLPGGWLQVLVLDERFVHDRKTDDDVRFSRQPVRYLVDGCLERQSFVLYGSLNLGEPYRASAEPDDPAATAVSGTAAIDYGNLGGEARFGAWAFGLRGRFATERLDQETRPPAAAAQSLSFERRWGRGELYGRWEDGDWLASALVGYAAQVDEFAASGSADGTYRMATGLYGLEGGYRGWDPFEVRLGYLGSYFRMRREVDDEAGVEAAAVADRTEEGYADKVHVKALYRFKPRVAVEVLLSKEVTRNTFGGFAVKAVAVF